jgi:hypothetical protein
LETLDQPLTPTRPASSAWNTMAVTMIMMTPSRRNTRKSVDRRSGRSARQRLVTPTIMFDWMVK